MNAAIILVLCLSADPSVCKEERPAIEVNLPTCAMQGPAIAAEFLADHPKWVLRGWKCQIGPRGRAA